MNAPTCVPGSGLVAVIVSTVPPSADYPKQQSTVMLSYPPGTGGLGKGRRLYQQAEVGAAKLLVTNDGIHLDGRVLCECGSIAETYDITWKVHESKPDRILGEDGEWYDTPRSVRISAVARIVA